MTLRTSLAILALVLGLPLSAGAFECPGEDRSLQSVKGTQSLAISTTSVGLTVPTQSTAMARITVEDQPIRYWPSGTPTASVGHLATAGTVLTACQADLATIRFIRQGGTDANLSITYYGP